LVNEFSALPKKTDYPVRILEVGTGSGCIPITLKKKLLTVELTSCDVSEAALHVAKKNSSTFETDINYLHLDFLNRTEWARIPSVDCIISNPPYVCAIEKETMRPNVLRYEPEQALFVPDQDPLIFYRAMADFGKDKLENSGRIYVEINENLAIEIASLFSAEGYSEIEIRMDMQGKQRMIKATWLP
jgi:release factor glutamine methyltransferase